MLVEIEIDRLDQLDAVLAAGPDIVCSTTCAPNRSATPSPAATRIAPSIELEASGGVNLGTVRAIAETGVDRISVGEITHSAPALDVALDWLPSTQTVESCPMHRAAKSPVCPLSVRHTVTKPHVANPPHRSPPGRQFAANCRAIAGRQSRRSRPV